jgi:organic radical activating enzyme
VEFLSGPATAPPGALLFDRRDRSGALVEGWCTARPPVEEGEDGGLTFRRAAEGCLVRVALDPAGGEAAITAGLARLCRFVAGAGLHPARQWSRRPPEIAAEALDRARRAVFSATQPPAGDSVEPEAPLFLELFAVAAPPVWLGRREQHQFHAAPPRPGEGPAAGAVVSLEGKRLLLAGATRALVGGALAHPGDPLGQLRVAVQNLRILVSQFNLKPHGIAFGFGLEDLAALTVRVGDPRRLEEVGERVQRYLDPDCRLAVVPGLLPAGVAVELEAVFRKKGEHLDPARRHYQIVGGRLRVESLELHAVEHCNLRCAGCDAMSPFNPERFLSLAEAGRVLDRLAPLVRADVFKLMGGEPLLHPEIVALLERVRASGIGRVLRLTTNGLLLHRMPDAFWRALDRLTVSNYASAPIPPAHVALIRERAEAFDVVLNLKWIDQFNQIERTQPIDDAEAVQAIYDDCWIRHRSLIVRDGVFYKCTRAAYLDDFRARLGLPAYPGDPPRFRAADGLALDEPDFQARALAYLNDPRPLAGCRFCLGAAGPLVPHTQLTRKRVRELVGGGKVGPCTS